MAGLDDLYRQIILDHYRNPRNKGTLPPPALKVEGFNPLCGDQLTLYVEVKDDKVTNVSIESTGCSISQASASLMTTIIKDKSLPEVHQTIHAFKNLLGIDDGVTTEGEEVKLGDLEALSGVAKFPVRIKCATLAWNALAQAIEAPEKDTPATTE
jgi:nitrogen fixation protein NifU and related proteins